MTVFFILHPVLHLTGFKNLSGVLRITACFLTPQG